MKRLTPYSWLILIIFSSCLTGNKVASTDKQIESLLSQMTLEEKILQLNQYTMGRNNNVNNIGEEVKNCLLYTSDAADE